MDRQTVSEQVIKICNDVFDNDDLVLTEDSSMSNVEEWDSLTHLSIINDIEDNFNISLTLEEISNSKSLKQLISAILKHLQ